MRVGCELVTIYTDLLFIWRAFACMSSAPANVSLVCSIMWTYIYAVLTAQNGQGPKDCGLSEVSTHEIEVKRACIREEARM